MCLHTGSSQAWHSKIQLVSLMEAENYFTVTSHFAGQMERDHFLCKTENLFLGAVLVDELRGVRSLETRGRCPVLYWFCMDSFTKCFFFFNKVFLCFFFSAAAFLHASLCSAERGNVATVQPSLEGLSQDVSLLSVYLLGKAEALRLA